MRKHKMQSFGVQLISYWLSALAIAQSTWAQAPSQPLQTLRIVGGLAGVNQYVRNEEPFWNRELARLSGGKYNAEIVPFDRAGVPGSEMLRLMQYGVVPFGTAILSIISGQNPELAAPDLAGMSPDIASVRKNLAAYRPYMEKILRERYGVELLAVYTYPAQVMFCKKAFSGLGELSGRRVRVSSATQADFVSALGATPVLVAMTQIAASLESGNVECAITGAMTGNSLGLDKLTQYVHGLPISWGVALFGANQTAWSALPGDLRALLSREIPKLEANIWSESERETQDGLACNQGLATCQSGRKGSMKLVPLAPLDEGLRKDIFSTKVLPPWLQRCNGRCNEIWNQTLGPGTGVLAPKVP